MSIEISIPVGEDAPHLLDPSAAPPLARAIGQRQHWISTTSRRSDSEIVVRLIPRGPTGVPLRKDVDASFLLTRAMVNGILSDQVVIRSKETYCKTTTTTVNGKEVVSKETIEITDNWVVAKE